MDGNTDRHIVQVVMLAAGGSKRFGQCKLLTPINHDSQPEKSLIEHSLAEVVSTCEQLSLPAPQVVLGGYQVDISAQLRDKFLHVRQIVNPQWQQGLSSSITTAVKLNTQEDHNAPDAIMLVLADQIALKSADYAALISAYLSTKQVTCSEYQNQLGVPAIFPRSAFNALLSLTGDKGAKSLLTACQKENLIKQVSVAPAAIDIDTPADLKLWLANKER
ncbi:nucleotidyltransferase family protein [Shewanella maritima]|uniref:nucleotidyltransferase family protein n=1 Tax=Shewanella maritima TaxID=2520507 RepID=UPI00373592C0